MNVQTAATNPPPAFAPVRRAFLDDLLTIDFKRLWLECEYLLLAETALLIGDKPFWSGTLTIDRFDPRLATTRGETPGMVVARHMLGSTPFCLSPADMVRNAPMVSSVAEVISKVLSEGSSFSPARPDTYAVASPAALQSLPAREFCIYCGYDYRPEQPFDTQHRVAIVSRRGSPHRLRCFLPAPTGAPLADGAWPECGSFVLADWTCDTLEGARGEGPLPRAWRLAIWESLHGMSRPERQFEAVLNNRRFVVLPSEDGGLRASTICPEGVLQDGPEITIGLGDVPAGPVGEAWHQAFFVARFGSSADAASARSLLLNGVEPRIDRLEELPMKGCAYVYYRGSDESAAGTCFRGMAHDYRNYWDADFVEKSGIQSDAAGEWRTVLWRRPCRKTG